MSGAYDAAWRRVRLEVLRRDAYRCQLCGAYGTHADHIVSLADGGARLDMANLRCLCARCNTSRGGRDGRGRQLARRGKVSRW